MKTFLETPKQTALAQTLLIVALSCSAFLSSCSPDTVLPIATESDALTSAEAARRNNPPPPRGDERLAGGATTVFVTDEEAFAQPAPNLSAESLRRHDEGDEAFAAEFAAIASMGHPGGLGPLFNHVSCEGCHIADGRGAPIVAAGEMNSLLIRLSTQGTDAHGAPLPVAGFGGQLQDQAIAGVKKEGTFSIAYTEQAGTFADGSAYSLRVPRYSINNTYLLFPMNAMISPRVASPVFGLGLLEAIDEETIVALADPNDRDNDGISGKANYVWDVRNQQTTLGRFGWKASQPSLLQQNAAAFNGDMGVTTSLFPVENSAGQLQAIPAHAPEVNDATLNDVVHYTRTLGVPARRNLDDAGVRRGKELFTAAKCAGCHTPSLRTGNLRNTPEVSNQVIFPYTDMLVHDMGEALADNRPDFQANGREWRTTPLWGVGLTQTVNKHTQLLHDGRARNLMEAILWHGGEANASREAVRAMPKADRDALIKFLESL